ncbi:STAS domain-containing protein [Streptomyces sp900116325]|uniref:Anti-sigma factor antagonist n=1 Tax=Streptomyces sp. 900116325 TaxID=3154295 RepID=A0ABV2UGM3_9ACTN
MTARAFESRITVHASSARVSLVGELDLDTAPHVPEAVAACLEERPKRLCLDLTGVSFCDCAGLNALLTARISALQVGVDFAVEGLGPQPARLLALVGADDFLTDDRVGPARRHPATDEGKLPLPTSPPPPRLA